MAPLAGRPPFEIDDKDTEYEVPQPHRRLRQPQPEDPNKRTSAYDVYDNYVNDDHRQSGIGALGQGFLNGDMDDDDDDDFRDRKVAMPEPQRAQASPLPSKHAALAAAIAPKKDSPKKEYLPPRDEPTPPPQYIAQPRPGYAAPIAALNLSRPEPAAAPPQRRDGHNLNLQITPPGMRQVPGGGYLASPAPSVPSTPHPLQPPMSPITPIFARPQTDVKFAIPREKKPIMRSGSEDALIPKRGDAGDDFWRRFSMVAKEENRKPPAQKESNWLRKTQSQYSSLSRWVWIIGAILLIAAAGGIGLGWYVSHNSTSHDQPTAIGGSAGEAADVGSSTAAAVGTGTGTAALRTSMHVTPTNTVARRALEPLATTVPKSHRRRSYVNVVQY